MARGKLEFLSRDDIERIHNVSIRVLEKVGVSILCPEAVDMLLRNGSSMSEDGKRVLMPEGQVMEAVAAAPKSILLAARDPKRDLKLPSEERMFVSNGGEGVHIRNLLTNETRAPRTEDVRDFARLVDSLDPVDFLWPMVGALDQPEQLKGLVEMRVSFESTTKHVQSGAIDSREAQAFIDLASILAGGKEALRERPIFSCVQCPISPLTFDDGLTEAQIDFARAGVPVVSMVASVAGLTSPVTLSGSMAQINAENLASCVISQAAAKGAPWIYSSDSAPGDLVSGSIDYGALEGPLLRTAAAQMGRRYGFVTMTGGSGLESTSHLLGRLRDGVPYAALLALVPSDLGSGFGSLDQAAGASMEQLVLDAWVWDVAKELARPFSSDDSAISFETIREAGLDGNFLGKRHTLTRFKSEFAAPRKPEAVLFGRNDSPPRGELLKKAAEEVRRLLDQPRKHLVSPSETALMDDLFKRFEA